MKFASLSSWRAWIEISGLFHIVTPLLSLSSWRAWIEMTRRKPATHRGMSLSSWRAWIEMALPTRTIPFASRSPHGERGLKCGRVVTVLMLTRRSPHGERGLKFAAALCELGGKGIRSPHGERGLKLSSAKSSRSDSISLSSWRAWIEIYSQGERPWQNVIALLMESVD